MDSARTVAATAADGATVSPKDKARSRGSRFAKAAIHALKKGGTKRTSGAATPGDVATSPTASLSDASRAAVDRRAAAGNNNDGALSLPLLDSSVDRNQLLTPLPSSPAHRSCGGNSLRMKAVLALGGSPDVPRRCITSTNQSACPWRHGLGGGGSYGDDDDECGALGPGRLSLDLPPRDFIREDRSRRVSPRPVDRLARTSTGRSTASSTESGVMSWAPPLSGVDEGTTPQSGSLRNSADPWRASREWPGRLSTDSASSQGGKAVASPSPRVRGQAGALPVARLGFGDGGGGGGGCSAGGEDSLHAAAFLSPSSDSLQSGGAEGELFGGVGYRRDDFRNMTLEGERASIRKSNAMLLLAPIGELPSTDPE